MGLDMMVQEVSRYQKSILQQFGQSVVNSMSNSTYNVHTHESTTELFDFEMYVTENPTASIPYQLSKELVYWRKHPDLHGWMKNLFFEKGGQTESDFNHDVVWLTIRDVINLKDAVENDKLPKTSGFFFGDSDGRIKETDLGKADLMLDALSKGTLIYYISSW